jgi:translation initiation factor eIF-2B subunit delta
MTEDRCPNDAESDPNAPSKKGKTTTSKAERRALQEAQRAAKQERLRAEGKPIGHLAATISSTTAVTSSLGRVNVGTVPSTTTSSVVAQVDEQKRRKDPKSEQSIPRTKKFDKEVPLFSHLQQYERERSTTVNVKGNIHPAILQVGLKFANYMIVGGNARCLAVLSAIRRVIQDYRTPKDQAMNRHLDSHLKPMINYLVQFRPMSVSMGNAIRYLKLKIANLSPDMPESDVS